MHIPANLKETSWSVIYQDKNLTAEIQNSILFLHLSPKPHS